MSEKVCVLGWSVEGENFSRAPQVETASGTLFWSVWTWNILWWIKRCGSFVNEAVTCSRTEKSNFHGDGLRIKLLDPAGCVCVWEAEAFVFRGEFLFHAHHFGSFVVVDYLSDLVCLLSAHSSSGSITLSVLPLFCPHSISLLTSVLHEYSICSLFFFSLSISSPPPSLPPSLQRCVRILFQDGERSAVRTLQWRAGETSEALAQLCASTFGVSDPQQYTLYWRSGGEMRALPPQAQPQDLASHSEGGPSLSYLRTDHDFSKMRRLTRGGAVDLSESVCEEWVGGMEEKEGGGRRKRRRRREEEEMDGCSRFLFLSLVLSLSLRRCVVSRRGSGLVVTNFSPSPD